MTFDDSFQEIKKSKDQYRISNLLGDLGKIEPDYQYLDDIKKLSTHEKRSKIIDDCSVNKR